MSDATAKADRLIHDNAVMIFSKTWCPHCAHSKEILTAKQKEYEAKGTPFSLEIYELNDARQ
jgi:glutaredoxin 3